MKTTLVLISIVGLVWAGAPTAFAQNPEERGALTPVEWDAGRIDAAGTMIRTRVVYPEEAGPYPLVGVIHGAGRTGGRQMVLAETLASRGFVAIVPDMPCDLVRCDHDANARQIRALLGWAVTQNATSGSMVEGKIDGTRRGLIGHSWGGLAVHLTAASDDTIDSLVLLDPNDDGTEGLDATPGIAVPTLQLLASVSGLCNSAWNEGMVTPMLLDPKLQLTVSGSGHCDPEEPGEPFCALGCGVGDSSLSSVFRRYAVAWTACALAADGAMAPWVGGGSMSGDESGGVIEGVVASGLDSIACRAAGPLVDAGTGELDGGAALDGGAGSDAGSPGADAGERDAGGASGRDAGSGSGDGDGDGCGCRAVGSTGGGGWIVLLVALALVVSARRARQERFDA